MDPYPERTLVRLMQVAIVLLQGIRELLSGTRGQSQMAMALQQDMQ